MLENGARAATVDALIAASGIPKGSIYHRFGSFDHVLAEMWLRAVRRSQERFLAVLSEPRAVEAAVAAALSLPISRANSYTTPGSSPARREDLLRAVTDPDLEKALHDVNEPLVEATRDLAHRLYGRASKAEIERMMCATIDLPIGAVRRHLIMGLAIPPGLREQLEVTVRAALSITE